jgi:glycosyltransferase involved in cell wall biosynthesis
LISVIIPTLNEEKLLPRLLDQLSDQNLKSKYEFEIIVSDGGSKDKTLEIAKNYTDKIVVYQEKRRQKISEGKNAGFKISKGEILVFICADCRIENPEMFFDYVSNFKNSKYLAATFWFDVFPEEKKWSDYIFHTFFNWLIKLLNYVGNGMGRGECQVIKREVFEKVGGYNEELTAGEDYDLYTRIRKLGKIDVNFKIKIFESPRRYRKYGYIKILLMWFRNSLRVFNILKTQVEEWKEVR